MQVSRLSVRLMESIRSRQNPLARHLLKLADSRRERLKAGQTVLVGTHLVQSALAAGWPLQRLLVCEGLPLDPEVEALVSQAPCPTVQLSPDLFAGIEQTPSSTGLMALADLPPPPSLRQQGCCLLLEGLQDPGNVGSILRTAVAAGVDQVWLTTGCADAWSPKVLRAGMGAHFHLSIVERVEPEVALTRFQGPVLVTTLESATPLYECDLRGDLVLALGSEGSGASPALLARASRRVRIPMAGPVESLNVGAAAAICLFERLRQELVAR